MNKRKFKNYHIYFIYIVSICVMCFATRYYYDNQHLHEALKKANSQLINNNETNQNFVSVLHFDLKKEIKEYHNLYNFMRGQKADSIIALADTLLFQLRCVKTNPNKKNIDVLNVYCKNYLSQLAIIIGKKDFEKIFKPEDIILLSMYENKEHFVTSNTEISNINLTMLENEIILCVIKYFQHSKTSIIHGDSYRHYAWMILNNPLLKKGDTLKAEAFFTKYISNPDTSLRIKINGKEIPMKEGVAYFQKQYNKVGKQTIVLESIVCDPITNKPMYSMKRDYIIQVLP